jgi:hypothetical protein
MKSKPYLKKVSQVRSPALSTEGELYTVDCDINIVVETNEGFTMWLDNLDPVIKNIKNLPDFKLLYWIGRNLKHNESVIVINGIYKKRIEEETGMSQPSINRSIRSLKDSNVLINYPDAPKSGIFYINPSFIWRGSTDERKKQQKNVLTLIKESNLPELEQQKIKDVKSYEKAIYKKSTKK